MSVQFSLVTSLCTRILRKKSLCFTFFQVDLSWHSVSGLTLYLDGQLVDEDSNPATNELDFRSSRRVLIGRANTDMRREHFTNGIFDSVEFWQASRDVLKAESYLSEGNGASTLRKQY